MSDNYVYPDSGVLKNKFNCRDTMLLNALERTYVPKRVVELYRAPIQGNFDLKHLQKIHEHLFQDVYTWAGKIRQDDIGKEDQLTGKMSTFCPSHRIDGFAEDITNTIKKSNYLKGLNKDQFAQKAAEVMGEINTLHPFREGNGRTQREFMRQLAAQAGWKLDLDGISKERMIEASVATMNMDYRGLEDIFKESLQPLHIHLSPEFQNRIQEIENFTVKGKADLLPAKDLYNRYAKKALKENEGIWNAKVDKQIILKMKQNEVSNLKINSALNHSPALIGLSNIEKSIKVKTLIQEVVRAHPELKRGQGISR